MTVLTKPEVAKVMRISPRTLERVSKQPGFPKPLPYVKRPLLWDAEAVGDYIKSLGQLSG